MVEVNNGVYKGLRYMYIKIHWIFDDKYFNFYSSYCVDLASASAL